MVEYRHFLHNSSKSTNLLSLLSWLDVNLGPLLEGLSEHVPDQRFTGNLHRYHVASTFQNSLRGVKLALNT